MFASNLLLKTVDLRRKEFHGTATLGADHVMVTSPIVLMLIAGDPVVKGDFACQSAF